MTDHDTEVTISVGELIELIKTAVREEFRALQEIKQKKRPRVEVENKPSQGAVDKVRRGLRRAGVKL